MEEIKQWKDVKVGDTVYFADEFAEPEPVVVEKIEPEEWDRYLHITVVGEVFFGETRLFRVVAPSHDKSLSIASRQKHEMLAGRLYTSVEAYKDVWTQSLNEQVDKLEKAKADIEDRIAHLKKDIETVAKLKGDE
jgi:hypothetical protein